MDIAENLKQSFKEFEEIQKKHRKLGARDTEPDYEFQNAMQRAFLSGEILVPLTAVAWHLFSNTSGRVASMAAQEMTEAAMRTARLIKTHREDDKESCREFLDQVLWRVAPRARNVSAGHTTPEEPEKTPLAIAKSLLEEILVDQEILRPEVRNDVVLEKIRKFLNIKES